MESTANKPTIDTQKQQPSELMAVRNFLRLCLSKWWWFIISIIVCGALAKVYLARTTPTYTRMASILIKSNENTPSYADTDILSELGINTASNNVNNELKSIQSYNMVMEVVRRLDLNIEYSIDGRYRSQTLYGRNLPVQVVFADSLTNVSYSFNIQLEKDSMLTLSDFVRNGDIIDGVKKKARLGEPVVTPVGKLLVAPTESYGEMLSSFKDTPIAVNRYPLLAAVRSWQGRMGAALNDKMATVIDIVCNDVSPRRAEDFLNVLITVYNEKWIEDNNQIAVSTSKFIDERLGLIRSELNDIDKDISSYKSQNRIPDVANTARIAMDNVNKANTERLELNNQLEMTEFVRGQVAKSGGRKLMPVGTGINSTVIEAQISSYNKLLLERNSLAEESSDQNPLVQDYDEQLAGLRSSILASIDNQINTLNTQIESLQEVESKNVRQVTESPQQQEYLQNVEREQGVKEALYIYLLKKREENELSKAFNAYNTRVIASPNGSNQPTSPSRRNIYALALLAGLVIPAGILKVRDSLNTKIRGRKDIEHLSTPFVGEIPQSGRRQKTRYLLASKSKASDYKLVVKPGTRNVFNEAFRVVRTNMEFMTAGDKGDKVIMLTSLNPGSGKTFLSMNLAASYAVKGIRVLAIDLDLRRASLSAYVGSPEQGVADFLNGSVRDWKPLITSVNGYDHFDVLPIGTMPPNPAELLLSEHLTTLIAELRDNYDVIFLDCPPVDIVADTSIIAKHADMTVFVIRAGLMERDMVDIVEKYYQEKRFNNMAVLLNGTGSKGDYSYGYGYGYGSSYGEAYGSDQ